MLISADNGAKKCFNAAEAFGPSARVRPKAAINLRNHFSMKKG